MNRALLATAALAIVIIVAAGSWFLLRGTSAEEQARSAARQYFAYAIERDHDAAYDMLATESRHSITRDEWRDRNESALEDTGALVSADAQNVERREDDVIYVTVELEFERHGSLPVVLRVVREEGQWRPLIATAATSTPGWQRVEPERDQ
jgi:hypothetical protein